MSEIVAAMPAYCSVKDKIKCKDKAAVMRQVEARVKGEKADLTDGIKVYKPEGWVLIRMSGTEPIIRVFAESKTDSGARKLAEYGVGLVNQFNH
jgi:phosphomannomutase/phosphoglucomutase